MIPTTLVPRPLPGSRILGAATADRRRLLACIDVVVGYVTARHRLALAGWRLEAALVEARSEFRGGETVALRATPLDGRSPADLPPVPLGVLREIGSRITESVNGIANVVPDVTSVAPDLDAVAAPLTAPAWFGDARTA